MKRVLLYGDSIWLDDLAEQLSALHGWRVVRAGMAAILNVAELASMDLVLTVQAHEAGALALMRACPAAALVSVDMATGTLTAASIQTCPVTTVQEVVHLTRGIIAARER